MSQHHTTLRLIVMLAAGTVTAIGVGLTGWWPYAATIGWAVAAAIYSAWVWIAVGRFDSETTRRHASREEPARGIADTLVLILSLASLFSVGFVLLQAQDSSGVHQGILAAIALASVALSWILLHTLFTLRYASMYYREGGGIDFNQPEPPRYADFAYLAFTVGMTFQISDTDVKNTRLRAAVLRHDILSFVFGSVIVATTVNLIAGLGR